MPFDKKKYEKAKLICTEDIESEYRSPSDYMKVYKAAIIQEDYERAKAIAEVLKPLGYYVADTHRHIPGL